MRRYRTIVTTAIALLAVVSCSDDNDTMPTPTPTPTPSGRELVKKVAVVAPIGDAATKTRLERTASWLAENLKEAQKGDSLVVSLQIEWYDEQRSDMETLGSQLAGRNDIAAIVGPFDNDRMDVFADACKKTHKLLIAPTITSDQVMRKYAVSTAGAYDKVNKESFFWPLSVSDVNLTETMMEHFVTQIGKYSAYGTLYAAFFSPYNAFGKTFHDWASFFASNMNVNLECNEAYTSTSNLQSRFTDYLNLFYEGEHIGPL